MPPDPLSWLPLFNQYGFPLVSLVLCGGGLSLFVIRYVWPFLTKEVWPLYVKAYNENHAQTAAEREHLIDNNEKQRSDAVQLIEHIREGFSIQLESRTQEAKNLSNIVKDIGGEVKILTVETQRLTTSVSQLADKIENMIKWDGADRRRK
jgi:hypothetical protein